MGAQEMCCWCGARTSGFRVPSECPIWLHTFAHLIERNQLLVFTLLNILWQLARLHIHTYVLVTVNLYSYKQNGRMNSNLQNKPRKHCGLILCP